MAGKKTFVGLDELNRTWIVQSGDPAFGLLTALKRKDPVLPSHVYREGTLSNVDYERWRRAVDNLGKWLSKQSDDLDQHSAYVRLVTLNQCLDSLRTLSI